MKPYQTLLEGLKHTSLKYPEDIALILQDQTFTYKEMYSLAQKQASFLLAKSEKTSIKRVAIFSYRTWTAYIGTLSALMTGAAFIPLNPKFPDERNISILEQCQPDVIIVDNASIDKLINISKKVKLSSLIFFPDGNIERFSGSGLNFLDQEAFISNEKIELPTISPDDDAYILFTSGSTGQPKGVPIKHKNVCSFLSYNQNRYKITNKDRLSQTFDQTFDLSVFDLFMAWCHGACLYAMRPIDLISPSKYINENKITIWFSVPSVISLLNKQGFLKENSFPTLRLSLFCGEPLLENQIASWANAAPNSVCENLYGPTELTIACSTYQWHHNGKNISYNGVVSIGKLYEHLEYILIDENEKVTDIEGELCVFGEQRFDGYLNSAIDACFVSFHKKKYYRTGDRVRMDKSGNLLYLGRTDQQVKINGYRVELGEIESVFAKISGVDRALVFCINGDNDAHTKKLAAYIIGSIHSNEILETAKKMLPAYMIPSQVKIEKNIPLNANGKIDRNLIKAQFSCYNFV